MQHHRQTRMCAHTHTHTHTYAHTHMHTYTHTHMHTYTHTHTHTHTCTHTIFGFVLLGRSLLAVCLLLLVSASAWALLALISCGCTSLCAWDHNQHWLLRHSSAACSAGLDLDPVARVSQLRWLIEALGSVSVCRLAAPRVVLMKWKTHPVQACDAWPDAVRLGLAQVRMQEAPEQHAV